MKVPSACLMLLTGALASCRHTAPAGTSAFSIVDEFGARQPSPTDASTLKITESMSIAVAPKPIPPLALPQYPPSALAAGLSDIQIAVTIVIDKKGGVIDVAPSLARLPYTTAFREEFLAAIEQAVRGWRFDPAQLARLAPQSNGRPLVTRIEAVEGRLTVAFVFSRSGKVSSDLDRR